MDHLVIYCLLPPCDEPIEGSPVAMKDKNLFYMESTVFSMVMNVGGGTHPSSVYSSFKLKSQQAFCDAAMMR